MLQCSVSLGFFSIKSTDLLYVLVLIFADHGLAIQPFMQGDISLLHLPHSVTISYNQDASVTRSNKRWT